MEILIVVLAIWALCYLSSQNAAKHRYSHYLSDNPEMRLIVTFDLFRRIEAENGKYIGYGIFRK